MDFGNEYSAGISGLGQFADLLVPIPLWSTCSAGEMVVVDPFSGYVQFIDSQETVIATDSVSMFTRELTEDDHRAYLNREMLLQWAERRPGEPVDRTIIENSIDNFLLHYWNRFPEVGPAAVKALCGADRQLFLQQFNTADHPLGYGTRWLVHEPGQTEIMRVQFPAGFVPWQLLPDGRVLGAYLANESAPVVAYIDLPPLEAAPEA